MIQEYSFCVDVGPRDLSLSNEHTETRWLPYKEADRLLTWDSKQDSIVGSQPAHNDESKAQPTALSEGSLMQVSFANFEET